MALIKWRSVVMVLCCGGVMLQSYLCFFLSIWHSAMVMSFCRDGVVT